MRKFLHGVEETKPEIFAADTTEEGRDRWLVLGAHRTHADRPAVRELKLPLPFRGVGPNRQARASWEKFLGRRDRDARIERQHAVAIRHQGVDIKPGYFGEIGRHLRQFY